jgi:hypothetical protein
MTESRSLLVLTDTSWNKVSKSYFFLIAITFISADIILPYLFLYVLPPIFGSNLNLINLIGIIIIANIPLIIFVIRLITFLTPLQKTKVLLSSTELKIYLQNNLFLHILLNEIRAIEALRIKLMGYKIIFKNLNTEEVLRLYLFLFKRSQQRLFVDYLKNVSKKLNITYIEEIQKAFWHLPEEDKANEEIVKKFILKIKY